MRNSWHKFQRYYFSFNRSDRNSISILVLAIFIVLIGTLILPNLIPPRQEDFSEIKALFDTWENKQKVDDRTIQLQLFEFDPNTITESKLDSLDLPVFVRQNMIRYREAGGKFKRDEDLRKIYGLTDSVFQIIQPFIHIGINSGKSTVLPESTADLTVERGNIPERKGNNEQKSISVVNRSKVELNSADSLALVELPGIGPVFSKRIISYRNLLGGFVKKEQLLEVYNFPMETFENISDMLEVDSTKVRKMRINFSDYSELLRHPYLNKEQVSAILDQRDKNGPFKNLSEVESIQVFDSESFARVRPYLTCK